MDKIIEELMPEQLREGVKAASRNVWFHIFSGIGIALLILSFVLPPTGVVDDSVLKASSLIFGFAALSILNYAIIRGADAKISHGDTSVEINTPDPE